jgi:hypothetical protein
MVAMPRADRTSQHDTARGSLERPEDAELVALMRRWIEELTGGDREDALSLSVALVVALSDALELERQRASELGAVLAAGRRAA